MPDVPEVNPLPLPHVSQKHTRILKNGEENVQSISREPLLVKNFLTRRLLQGATLKF